MAPHELLTLRIHAHTLPGAQWDGHTALMVGLQQGSEPLYKVDAGAETALLQVEVRLVQSDSEYDFRGPAVFGPRGGRFLYLAWGEEENGEWKLIRRTKIPLVSLLPALPQQEAAQTAYGLSLGLTGSKGDPLCASLPLHMLHWKPEPL